MSLVRAAATGRPSLIAPRGFPMLSLDCVVSHRLPLEQARQVIELTQTDAATKFVMAPHGATA
jgi:hypothetical protein